MKTLAFIFGIIAFIFFVLSIQNKNKEKLLIFQLIANAFYGIQYILLQAFSTGMFNFISILRSYIFYKYSKSNKKIPRSILIFFICIILFIGIFQYSGLLSLIPLTITVLNTIYTYSNNMKTMRIMFTLCAVFWFYYNLKIGAYGAVLGNVFELASGISAVIKYRKKEVI